MQLAELLFFSHKWAISKVIPFSGENIAINATIYQLKKSQFFMRGNNSIKFKLQSQWNQGPAQALWLSHWRNRVTDERENVVVDLRSVGLSGGKEGFPCCWSLPPTSALSRGDQSCTVLKNGQSAEKFAQSDQEKRKASGTQVYQSGLSQRKLLPYFTNCKTLQWMFTCKMTKGTTSRFHSMLENTGQKLVYI